MSFQEEKEYMPFSYILGGIFLADTLAQIVTGGHWHWTRYSQDLAFPSDSSDFSASKVAGLEE